MLLQTRPALHRGILCQVRKVNCAFNRTPQAPDGHLCNRGCGGRLHGNCGSMFGDNELHRICCACVAKNGKRKAPAAVVAVVCFLAVRFLSCFACFFLFFFCNSEASAPGRHERTCFVVRVGITAVVDRSGILYSCVQCRTSFFSFGFHLATPKEGNAERDLASPTF